MNHVDTNKTNPVHEAVFYELSLDDEYSEVGGIIVEVHENDHVYPLSLSTRTEDDREIGLVLTRKLLRRIIAEAYAIGVI